jgi:hypothetical protein
MVIRVKSTCVKVICENAIGFKTIRDNAIRVKTLQRENAPAAKPLLWKTQNVAKPTWKVSFFDCVRA